MSAEELQLILQGGPLAVLIIVYLHVRRRRKAIEEVGRRLDEVEARLPRRRKKPEAP